MSDQLIEKFKKEIDAVSWEMLKAHYSRDTVLIVDTFLELIDVAVAIASDDKTLVTEWLHKGLVYRPQKDQVQYWSSNAEEMMGSMLIVSPFVLVQPDKSPTMHS